MLPSAPIQKQPGSRCRKNELDAKVAAYYLYDDSCSDDKGAEPKGLTIGKISDRTILFGAEKS